MDPLASPSSSYSRVRSVRLRRENPEQPFGFSVRGGHEHGTGIFVSSVDPLSQAYGQGLKVGDQILRVNGFPVSAAVHHEVLAIMRLRPALHLKVRSVGMLPVKERAGDPLTWKLVEEQPQPPLVISTEDSDASSQPDSSHPTEAKVTIDMAGQTGLGCCICKGPPERPGIFVQSTRSNGVAREAGLRPGDQLLACNGHSFLHIPFAEAVHHLKASQQLRLRVLKGAAADLFPGESSGYNSSASSLNGDPPGPCQSAQDESSKSREKPRVPLDSGMEWDEVEQVWRSAERETIVIEVKGSDPTLSKEEERLAEERRKLEETQRRLLEEALRLEEERRKFEEEKRRAHARPEDRSGSASSTESHMHTLAGALTQEILKRNERREGSSPKDDSAPSEDERPKPGTVEQKRTLFASQIDFEKRQQHEQLIEEFKRAHKKMFAASLEEKMTSPAASKEPPPSAATELDKRKRVQKELDHERQMVAQRVAGIVRQRQLRIERQHQESQETEREIRTKSPPPPPPPPLPSTSNGSRAPPPPNPRGQGQGQGQGQSQERRPSPKANKAPPPPPLERPGTPSPDYSTSNSPSPTPTPCRRFHGNGKLGVDMQSLESYRLKDPPTSPKKPPPVYFPEPKNLPGILKPNNGNGQPSTSNGGGGVQKGFVSFGKY